MPTQEKDTAPSLTDLVREAYIAAAPGPSDVTSAAAQACYGYLLGALEDVDDPAPVVAAAVAGVMEGAKKRIDPFWHAARGALVGVIHAGVGQRLELEPLVEAATRSAMDTADSAGGDFAAAAQGAVEGAVIAGDELSLDDEGLGSCAARASLERAQELGPAAHDKVHSLVTRRVLGVSITVPEHLRLD